MCKEIINNRVFIDNEPTNLYVCDLCGDMVTTLRSHTTLDDKDVQAATIVLTLNTLFKKSLMNTIYKAIAMRLYLDYVNNFLIVKAFADAYNITSTFAKDIISKGKSINNNI